MASPGGNMLPPEAEYTPLLAGAAAAALGGLCLYTLVSPGKAGDEAPGLAKSFFLFFYSCFVKPHRGDGNGSQQDALESFYGAQAGAYDSTRKVLLKGREDMLALAGAQLKARSSGGKGDKKKRVWVDVRGPPLQNRRHSWCWLGGLETEANEARLAAERATMSRQWPASSTSPPSSRACTSSISRPRSAMLRGSASSG